MDRYCESIFETRRFKTREVKVGQVGVGGANPIRIQSMTTSDTRDVEKTLDQIVKLQDHGCEIVRVTVQGKKEAESCEKIKSGMISRGISMPLVADIHFYPPAALLAAQFVDKIRINPGNFVDRRAQFKTIHYDDASYALELEKIEEGFSPLVEVCKRLKRAMRIGVNHGSLSDRIMNRYGDSPKGMVESALEFARVCRKIDYHDIVFSMKASNPIVMVQAYRLLVSEMMRLGWDYPLHIGVTEAGFGEEGRIKSAMGIGALLLDGLGDTIRVSLTEDPWDEIDPCRRLVRLSEQRQGMGIEPFEEKHRNPFSFDRKPVGLVVVRPPYDRLSALQPDSVLDESKDCILKGGLFPDGIALPQYIVFQPQRSVLHETRRLVDDLKERSLSVPVVVDLSSTDLMEIASDAGALFCDGLIDGVCLSGERCEWSFKLLQAARIRMTKTDYISCPGCGRTLFELQTVSQRIRDKTAHLPGVKIAIMGCIVNGPGEMADADFGYVGSKPGKIDLYVGKTCVERDIDFADADRKLIELIAAHGKWIEPDETKI